MIKVARSGVPRKRAAPCALDARQLANASAEIYQGNFFSVD